MKQGRSIPEYYNQDEKDMMDVTYNDLKRFGTLVRNPRWLITAISVDGQIRPNCELPLGTLSTPTNDVLDYAFYRLLGPHHTKTKGTILTVKNQATNETFFIGRDDKSTPILMEN